MSIYAGPDFALGEGGDYIMLPGARLEVSSGGKLYETLGQEEALAVVNKADTAKALAEPDQRVEASRAIGRMKRSLVGWLKYRQINDEVASGKRAAKTPVYLAAASLQRDRDWEGEQKLARDLHMLLSRIHPASALPVPDVARDPDAAVKLAAIAIAGKPPAEVSSPQATGILPLLILTVGAVVLFSATSAISNRAEVQKETERLKCIRDGACTDYGFWLKAAGVVVIGWFVWDKLGVGQKLRGAIHKGGTRRRRARR